LIIRFIFQLGLSLVVSILFSFSWRCIIPWTVPPIAGYVFTVGQHWNLGPVPVKHCVLHLLHQNHASVQCNPRGVVSLEVSCLSELIASCHARVYQYES